MTTLENKPVAHKENQPEGDADKPYPVRVSFLMTEFNSFVWQVKFSFIS